LMHINNYTGQNYSNLDLGTSKILYPLNTTEILEVIDYAKVNKKKILCIGSSLSWYDTILNTNNIIINLKKFEKTFDLNEETNILTVSTSYKINEILDKLSSNNLSLYSIPGHLDVTIGGCVANDVHGKDTFKFGNFGNSILDLEIILPNKEIVICSDELDKNLFLATIGGLGLTGVITKIRIKLKKISNFYETESTMCGNYKELIKSLYENNNMYDYIYGWVDIHSTKDSFGRGIIFKSKKKLDAVTLKRVPFFENNISTYLKGLLFSFCIRKNLIKYLNILFYFTHLINKKKTQSYKNLTSPLKDSGLDLKKIKLCPPNSFYEIQVIIKNENLIPSLYKFIKKCQDLKLQGSIVGIKIHKKNNAFISFSDNGISINVNHIFKHQDKQRIALKFKELHDFVIENNFKINIAKDFFFDKKSFEKNYDNCGEFFSTRKRIDEMNIFQSDFLTRINK